LLRDSDSPKARILLVDDHRANLIALEAVLESPDHELVSVSSGAEALRELERSDFAVILLDVQMPIMDGLETATKIKAIERARHVPIIFVTAIDHDASRVTQAYKTGAVDFIQKPFEAEIMCAKVSVFVELYRANQRARAETDRLAASLEEADRLKQEFLSTLGQELRTPLNAILGWTRMLRDGSVREAQRGRALETVERNAGAQLELIEEMLDISRITSGKLTLELANVDLSSIIELAVEAIRPLALEKQVGLYSALERDVAPLRGDAERLRQVVCQLVGNAVKFTASGGVVTVSLCNAGSQVEIAVEDNGVGIDAERLPNLFDRFDWKQDGGTPRAQGGVGVRLAIVHHLVELHDGTIHAESAGTGQGSRFVVKLPARGPKLREADTR